MHVNMTKNTICKFKCKDCDYTFSMTVLGSNTNCPQKGDPKRDCPECGSKNVKMMGGLGYIIIMGLFGLGAALIAIIYFYLKSLDWAF